MSFFEDLPQPPEPPEDDELEQAMPEWFGPPEQVMGAVVPLAEVVVRTEHVFVGLRSMTAYRTGLSIDVVLAVRRGQASRERWAGMADGVWGQHRPGAAGAGGLRWGVELADGRRTSALDRLDCNPEEDPSPPVLVEADGLSVGNFGMVERNLALWLWPIPEGETFSLVVQWPDLDVRLTTCRLDLAAAHVAAEKGEPFWL